MLVVFKKQINPKKFNNLQKNDKFFRMFSFLFSLSFSLNIPFQTTQRTAALYIKDQDIPKLSQNETLVVFRTAPYNTFLIQPFMEAQAIFEEIHPFAVIFNESMPALEFYENSQKIAEFSPIFDETVLLTCLSTVLDKNPPVSKTIDEVFSNFGQTQFTIIGSIDNYDEMVKYAISVPKELGVCSLCFAEKQVLEEIGINSEKTLGVYHKMDDNICTFDAKSAEAFKEALKPKFGYMKFDELKNISDKLTFTLMRETIDKNHSSFLFDMSEKYPNVNFAVFNNDEMGKISFFTHLYTPYGYNARMIVLNVSGGYFYNSDPYLGELGSEMHFDIEKWEEKASQFIDSIMKNEIPKSYKSEYVPRASFMQSTTKLVGLTYKEFFEQHNTSDIAMYFVVDNLKCRKIFDDYMKVGNALFSQMKYDGCRLAFVDVEANMIEGGFPVKEEDVPAVGIFRASDRKLILMEGNITAKAIGKFIHDNGSNSFDYQQFIDIIEPKQSEL